MTTDKEINEIADYLKKKKIRGYFILLDDGELVLWKDSHTCHEAMNRFRIHIKGNDELSLKAWFETHPTTQIQKNKKGDSAYIG